MGYFTQICKIFTYRVFMRFLTITAKRLTVTTWTSPYGLTVMVSGFHSRTARPDRLKGTGDIPRQRYQGMLPCTLVTICKVWVCIFGLPRGPTRQVKPPKDVFWWDQLIAVSLGPKLPLLIRLWTKKGPIPCQSKGQDCILGLPQGPTRQIKP